MSAVDRFRLDIGYGSIETKEIVELNERETLCSVVALRCLACSALFFTGFGLIVTNSVKNYNSNDMDLAGAIMIIVGALVLVICSWHK